VGKLNYLEKGSRPDIAYAVHQCARFSADPKQEHGDAIRWLAKYLKGTREKGMILLPTVERQLEVFVDADFAGNWDPAETDDRDTARSRHGYLIYYAGCPILWKSQLQTECALSSTESEYTGLSYALRDAIPIMNLFEEMIGVGMPVKTSTAKVHCRVFEDNTGALEIAKVAKYRPRTKHLNNRLHHFRSYVENGQISIHKIDTLKQPADVLTKPLNAETFAKFRRMIMGW
jgi:ATP-binding cassette subfamily B (MDR/TAP) protein 1